MTAIEREIREIPPLTARESSLLNLHSVLNVLNVLIGELTLLGHTLAEDDELLEPATQLCWDFQRDLMNPEVALEHARSLPAFHAKIQGFIQTALAQHPARATTDDVRESLDNIESVFAIFEVRAREILARAQAPDAWLEVPVEELRRDFQEVFAAIEKNSHGRYRIIYNLARQQPADYYIDFVIESDSGSTVALPLLFKDIMRDLLANARKYTAPGGTINAGLHETETCLRFSVQDTGCGIPADEIDTIVHYGKRGSNVGHVRTLGGGFGLTKAFLVTKQFGGRFWIRSELSKGTRIRIEIPRPKA